MTINSLATTIAFKRGFLLTNQLSADKKNNLFDKFPSLKGWQDTYFAQWRLLHDPLLNFATSRDNDHGVAILGLAINPFDGLTKNSKLAEVLHAKLKEGESRFLDYVDQITGSFIILYRFGGAVRIIQDAAATKPLYYHFAPDGTATVASHIRIVADMHGLQEDEFAKLVYSDEDYRADPSRYLPGLTTAFVGASPLTANSALDLQSKSSRRIFPRAPLEARDLDVDLVSQISKLFRAQMNLLTSERDICIAATGGRDSRLSIAALGQVSPESMAFTFHYEKKAHLSEDVEIARKISELKGLPFVLGDLGSLEKPPNFLSEFRQHSPLGIWPDAANFYLQTFKPDAVHVRSTVSEIGRCFYTSRAEKSISAQTLAKVYTRSKFSENPALIDIFEKYIELTNFRADQFFNYDWYDMFYWEHRNSKWQNILCSEAELATDVFIPYNNREILKMFLSVPYKDRVTSKLHFAVINHLEPAFADIPIV